MGIDKSINKSIYDNLSNILPSSDYIRKDFCKIWRKLKQEIKDINIDEDEALKKIKNLVIYDILDGSRTSNFNKKKHISDMNKIFETPLFTLSFIHILKSLGANKCIIMLHTDYNRRRGKKEFQRVLKTIQQGSYLIKKYCQENNIKCNCLCKNDNYELSSILYEIQKTTENNGFEVYFLFDYNEMWATTFKGQKLLNIIPDIDVHIRHTKFQSSGGWIPEKMSRSVFLYSQNGTTFSNWSSEEMITMIALSLIAKIKHTGEILSKRYKSKDEIINRYLLREEKLFNKTIYLNKKPKKYFVFGSPIGLFQIYF